jgi:hypothetical protein
MKKIQLLTNQQSDALNEMNALVATRVIAEDEKDDESRIIDADAWSRHFKETQ